MDIDLFLAHADDHQPLLAEGMPRDAAYAAPRPAIQAIAPDSLRNRSALADSLPEQQWAVVAPKGPEGDRLLALIEPLRKKREEEQGAPAVIYRVDPGMGPAEVTEWARRDYWDVVGRLEEYLPGYLLVLGDAGGVSWEFQQLMASEAYVGRIAFPDDRGYEEYVQKVLRWEGEPPQEGASALFYTARDGSNATVQAYQHLMLPSLEIARDRQAKGRFPAADIVDLGAEEAMASADAPEDQIQEVLRRAELARAGLLFSISHGLGAPKSGGWSSAEVQRAQQGAMVLSRHGHRIVASDLRERRFLPGGLWFYFACFGAGTPAQSAYYHWLCRLHELGHVGPAERVLGALPKGGDAPFVAALPQAALANPNGPLGVIGHVDLAWTWSFLEHTLDGSGGVRKRAERFQGLLRSLVDGHRIGVGHNEVARFFTSVDTELAMMYGATASANPPPEDDARKVKRASLWMQRQDLSAYVLLGDPAARLPIAPKPAGLDDTPRKAGVHTAVMDFVHAGLQGLQGQRAAGVTAERAEEAVLAAIRETAAAAAGRFGVAEADVEEWVRLYKEAGRAALSKKLR